MSDFTPSRLTLARKRRGVTKKALAESAGISARTLDLLEGGYRDPAPQTLVRLADALGFPATFFSAAEVDELSEHAASFRSLARLTAKQRDQSLAAASLALDLAAWVHARFTLPAVDIMRLRGVDAETAAYAIRHEWGLGESPVSHMIHLLEAHGVRVFSLAEECREVDAFSFWLQGTPYVFLNTMKSSERSRMDAAHELGHLVMHSGHETPRGKLQEREAQAFGAAFLMPRRSVLAEAPLGARVDQLMRLKRHWGVAIANLAYRLHTLDLLTDWQYRSTFIQLSERGYLRDEPEPMPRETSKVWAKVFELLRAKGTSKADMARELHVPVEELNKLVFGLVLTGFDGAGNGASRRSSPDRLRAV